MPRLRPGLPVFILLLAALWLRAPTELTAQSQTTSAMRGMVVDVGGMPIAEATVRIRHALTGAERTVITSVQGRFLALLLQPGGPYALTVTRIGYAESAEEGIQLQVGETYTAEIVLQDRAVEVEGVAVNVERSAIFNPDQVGPATLLDQRTVESVPVLSRDVTELAILSPLVRTTEAGGFSVGGQNDRYNALLVDGLLNKDAFGLTAGGVPGGQAGAKLLPIDAVAQYEILVAPYDARLSGFAGGVMNAVTKTGTNDWMVRGLAVGRHSSLMGDLTLPSGPAEASGVERTLVGATVSGPIIRDKAHFLVSTEFERRSQPPAGYNSGRDLAALVGIEPVAIQAFQSLMEDGYGVETGVAGSYPLSQTLANVFARADWHFGNGNRLTARNVFAYADNDESPNRAPFDPYEFSSNAVFRTSGSNTSSLQFFTDLGNRGGNEIDLTVQRTTDRTNPASDLPQIEAVLRSPDGAYTAT
ncbi:MAG TPA: carboxypeptidase regulatory-like domain-containing protein, partial [Longimicrobiales bacterium]|nr:carboxypeptidase regulatory-like domain-containing protein [Longimicrobiales bacterium]